MKYQSKFGPKSTQISQYFHIKMQKRELARGVFISELGFGAAPLGGEYGPISQEISNEVGCFFYL
jgi:hypothetical protein